MSESVEGGVSTFHRSGGCAKTSVNSGIYRVEEQIDGPDTIIQVYAQNIPAKIPAMTLKVTMKLTKLTASDNFPRMFSEQRLMHRTFSSSDVDLVN